MTVFILWSCASASWAASPYSVAHHTLLWTAYLIFFIAPRARVSNKVALPEEVQILAGVIFILTSICLIEYYLRPEIDEAFGFRYARFAEIWAAMLPLAGAYLIRLSSRPRLCSVALFILLSAGIIASQSRGSLFAALVGLLIFGIVAALTIRKRAIGVTAACCLALLIGVGAAMQYLPLLSGNEHTATAIGRLTTDPESDPGNSIFRNIRRMFLQIGLGMIGDHPLNGIGADNFWMRANEYRAAISADPKNRELVEGNETAIPERAHNEYLQVAAELGVPGLAMLGALLAAIMIGGAVRIWRERGSEEVIIKIGAFAGACAFLLSSAYSSFSFRLAQNGLIFFFLARMLLRENDAVKTEPSNSASLTRLIGIAAMLGLFVLSGTKALSQYYTYRGERETSLEAAGRDLLFAHRLDPDNYAADVVYGMVLFNTGYYESAADHLESAVEHGVGTPAVVSYLISSRYLANDMPGALTDAQAGVEVLPYSVFMRTRYSVLLELAGRHELAAEQFAAAQSVDGTQAVSWRSLITEGPSKTAAAGQQGVGTPKLADLRPQECVYAIIAERNILHPEEKSSFLGGPHQ